MVRQLLLAIGLGMITLAVAADEPPKPKVHQKPSHERLLKGDDAKKAADLEKRVAEREAADDYAEASKAAEDVLALRSRAQGAEHWEVVIARWKVVAVGKVAALPEAQRAGWRKALEGETTADTLERNGMRVEALPHRLSRLKWCREILGEYHPDTATSYSRVAANLERQKRLADARPYYQKSLDIYQQVLGDDHPRSAASYNNLGHNLAGQGEHVDAQPLFQKALDIFRRVHGEEHWLTVISYNGLAGNLIDQKKYAEAQPLYQKALKIQVSEGLPNVIISYLGVAHKLADQGKFLEAHPLFQKALDITLLLYGNNNPRTADCYTNVALMYDKVRRPDQALPLHQKALDIRRRVYGNGHNTTAISYLYAAGSLNKLGQLTDAELLFQKALDIFRALGEDTSDTIRSYHGLAINLTHQGKYADAQVLYQNALDISRRINDDDHIDTAFVFSGMAGNLNEQGKYVEAQLLSQKAFEIHLRQFGEDDPHTINSYASVTYNLFAQGKHAEALFRCQKSLELCVRVYGHDHPDTAHRYNEVAVILNALNKHTEALPPAEKSLEIRRRLNGDDHPDTAQSYNNVAAILAFQGKHLEAQPHYQHALDGYRRMLGDSHPKTILCYQLTAYNLHALGKFREAIAAARSAARGYESARPSVAARGLDRAAFGAHRSPYKFLAVLHAQRSAQTDAWDAAEADLARGLADETIAHRAPSITPAETAKRGELLSQLATAQSRILTLLTHTERTPAENRELDRLRTDRTTTQAALADLAVAISRRERATLQEVQTALPNNTALVVWVDVIYHADRLQEHWGCVVRRTGEPAWVRLSGSGPNQSWTSEDTALPKKLRIALASRTSSAAEIEALARSLHAQRIAPLRNHFEGIQTLYVVPVNEMAGIPIELLTSEYTISYVPSGTFLARLQNRTPPAGSALLALGDPVFSRPDVKQKSPTALPPGGLFIQQVAPGSAAAKARLQHGDVLVRYGDTELTTVEMLDAAIQSRTTAKVIPISVWREGEEKLSTRTVLPGPLGVVFSKLPARVVIADRHKTDVMIRTMHDRNWGALPDSRVEVLQLAKLFDPRATTLLGSAASEQSLDGLRRKGEMSKFRYLHFATHGEANQVQAFESALILAQDTLPETPLPRAREPFINGKLSAREVLEFWKLDAELVTLSACETALGQHGGGDGLLGFAQAFLTVGSRSVCLSLWKVDDTATALLMIRFYQNLLGKRDGLNGPMPKALALAEAKNWLRELSAEDALKLTAEATGGVVRGDRDKGVKLNLLTPPVEPNKPPTPGVKPFAHPKYWAAFILIGDPG